MTKSYVTMERKMCPVCGKEFDTNSILMDKRLGKRFDMHTTTGYELCPEHQKLHKAGYVAMVVADERRSSNMGSTLKCEDAHRTGEIIHLKRTVAKDMFGDFDMKIPMVFIDTQLAKKLHKMQERSKKCL